ncbi:MAG: TlpA family protein disulfide reductase [Aureispira sp.]|nr:TlpA family protein disulfide reductase [Aureispira sp.]
MKQIILTIGLFLWALSSSAQTIPTPQQTISEDGTSVNIYNFASLAEFIKNPPQGTTYVINFWATWCGPCVKELPHFEALQEDYTDKNVKVLLVSLDFEMHWKTKLLSFLEKKDLKSEVLVLDQSSVDEWIEQVDKDCDGALPATLILNKNNRAFYPQEFEDNELEETVNKFLESIK